MRAAALAAGPCAMLVIAATPFLLINEQPESWQLAIPWMLGLMLSVGLTLGLVRAGTTRREGRLNAAAIALFRAALAGVLYPVAAYEAGLRILGEDLDREVIEVIRAHWGEGSAKAAEFRVIVFSDPVSSNNAAFVGLEDIATAYHKIGPTTSLDAPWAWRGFVAEHGLRPIPAEEARAFQGLRERCLAEAGPGQRYTGWRVFHDDARHVSAICRR
jgi:hypothetical protein